MKTIITSAIVAFGILASMNAAHAYGNTIGDYQGVFAEAMNDNS